MVSGGWSPVNVHDKKDESEMGTHRREVCRRVRIIGTR